jgi:hypothetical protein
LARNATRGEGGIYILKYTFAVIYIFQATFYSHEEITVECKKSWTEMVLANGLIRHNLQVMTLHYLVLFLTLIASDSATKHLY